MHLADAYRNVLAMVRAGHLDLTAIKPRAYPLAELPLAMEAARTAGSLESFVIKASG